MAEHHQLWKPEVYLESFALKKKKKRSICSWWPVWKQKVWFLESLSQRKGKFSTKFGRDFNSPSGYFYLSSTPLLLKLFAKTFPSSKWFNWRRPGGSGMRWSVSFLQKCAFFLPALWSLCFSVFNTYGFLHTQLVLLIWLNKRVKKSCFLCYNKTFRG